MEGWDQGSYVEHGLLIKDNTWNVKPVLEYLSALLSMVNAGAQILCSACVVVFALQAEVLDVKDDANILANSKDVIKVVMAVNSEHPSADMKQHVLL
jgi:hypothetical protein